MAPLLISDAERLNRLRLIRSDNVGAITWHRLVARFGSATAALDALPDLQQRGGGRSARLCSAADATRELATAAAGGMTALFHGESAYPARLAEI